MLTRRRPRKSPVPQNDPPINQKEEARLKRIIALAHISEHHRQAQEEKKRKSKYIMGVSRLGMDEEYMCGTKLSEDQLRIVLKDIRGLEYSKGFVNRNILEQLRDTAYDPASYKFDTQHPEKLFAPNCDHQYLSVARTIFYLRAIRFVRQCVATDWLYEQRRIQDIIQMQHHEVTQKPLTFDLITSVFTCSFGSHRWSLLGVGLDTAYAVCERCLKTKAIKCDNDNDKKIMPFMNLVSQSEDPFMRHYLANTSNYFGGSYTRRIRDSLVKLGVSITQPRSYKEFKDQGRLSWDTQEFHKYLGWDQKLLGMLEGSNDATSACQTV